MRWKDITEGEADRALNESAHDVGLHGWWITDTGEHIDLDHDNDQHHADVAAAAFDVEIAPPEDDEESDEWEPDAEEYGFSLEDELGSAEEAIKAALDFGWVRGSGYGSRFTIEWETLSAPARKALLSWVRQYGPAYQSIIIDSPGQRHQRFDTPQAALAFLRSTGKQLAEQVVVRGAAPNDIDGKISEVVIHRNPGRTAFLSLLQNSREKTLRGFLDEASGDFYVWDAYLTDHGGADALMQKNGLRAPFPRIIVELENGRPQPFAYVDHGMSREAWGAANRAKLERAVGPFEWKWS